ncbi:MAG: DUF4416 family protein [Acidobacteriota bacterium]
MGLISTPAPVKLFCGILLRDFGMIEDVIARLEALASAADYCSLPVDFTFTTYYEKEMGPGLHRMFVSFERRIDPAQIAGIKIATNQIEREMSDPPLTSSRRRVNLDPGFLTPHSVVLASTKDYQHRIPAGRGIYLEQEMLFTRKEPVFLPWTYPDYRSPDYVQIFLQMHQIERRSRFSADGARSQMP